MGPQDQILVQVRACGATWKYSRLLLERRVHERRWRLAQPKMLDVAYTPDDLPRTQLVHRVGVVAQQDLLPDGVFTREEFSRKSLIHHDHPRRRLGVVFVQVAPFAQRNLQRPEYARAHFAVAGVRTVLWRR